ncbi:MAG: GHKL domain-containing protein [Ruthenibacterium sp.]
MLSFTFFQYRLANFLVLLFSCFFVQRRYSRRITALILTVAFILSTALDLTMVHSGAQGAHLMIFTAVQIILTQASIFSLCRYRDGRTLFTGFSIATYVFAGSIFGVAAFYATEKIVLSLLFEALVALLILLFLLHYLRDTYLDEQRLRTHGWMAMCVIPTLFYLALYSLSVFPGNLFKTPANIITVAILLVMMAVAYALMFRLLAQQRRDDELLRNNELLETYAKRMQHESEILQKAETETSIMRHDMRHHVRIMASYLQAGKLDLLQKAFEETDASIDALKPKQYCENIAVNGIVSQSAAQAAQEKIAFTAQLDIPKTLPVSDFEFSIVVSNLLENALHAAAKVENPAQRHVEIHAHRTKNRLILEVSNSFTGTLHFLPNSTLPQSSGGDGHGYGMRSILAFAQKYDAIFDYSAEENCFFARLLLNGF